VIVCSLVGGTEFLDNSFVINAPNNGQSYSFVKQWWKDVKNCVGNVGGWPRSPIAIPDQDAGAPGP
jgi:hypothetical protein